MRHSRRGFLQAGALGSLFLSLPRGNDRSRSVDQQGARGEVGKRPIIISAANGYAYLDEAYMLLANGGDTLDAALKVVKGPEDDPNDTSVGLGGLPNEEGTVELDACCMHGPSRRAGAVGGVRNIRNVSLVAKAVMEHTGHIMLVGEGAERFAVAQGFKRENLLTDSTRRIWLLWKEAHSDWWGPSLTDPNWHDHSSSGLLPAQLSKRQSLRLRVKEMKDTAAQLGIPPKECMVAIRDVMFPPTGTIHCSALNEKGEISGCTTTSGLAWKIPGRVGDSGVVGAGCYTDQDVGSAGATGSGEENIKVAGAHAIVENMRKGMSPTEAGINVLDRIVRTYRNNKDRLRYVDMKYYILRIDGAYAGVSLWEGYQAGKPHKIAIHDGIRRLQQTEHLLPGPSHEWPPT
jgi:N4-(beta-N-acetylglucosaminyl)-L-asparaginase